MIKNFVASLVLFASTLSFAVNEANEAMFKAISQNDVEGLKDAISNGAFINRTCRIFMNENECFDENLLTGPGETSDHDPLPIEWRNSYNQNEDFGMNVINNDVEYTPLHLAVLKDNVEMVKVLLDAYVDVNKKSRIIASSYEGGDARFYFIKDVSPLDDVLRFLSYQDFQNHPNILNIFWMLLQKGAAHNVPNYLSSEEYSCDTLFHLQNITSLSIDDKSTAMLLEKFIYNIGNVDLNKIIIYNADDDDTNLTLLELALAQNKPATAQVLKNFGAKKIKKKKVSTTATKKTYKITFEDGKSLTHEIEINEYYEGD